MRLFNRLIMALAFAGLTAAGVFAVLYSFDLFGFNGEELLRRAQLPQAAQAVEGFVSDVEDGSLSTAAVAILGAVALVGLALLILELRPGRPSLVRLGEGASMTRRTLEEEISREADGVPEVLTARARVKPRSREGADVRVTTGVRHGEDANNVRSKVEQRLRGALGERGVSAGRLKIDINHIDPPDRGREGRSRVR